MVRIASATGVPWATRTSTWRSLATISSGLCLFLDMDPSSFGSEAILQGGPLQRGRIISFQDDQDALGHLKPPCDSHRRQDVGRRDDGAEDECNTPGEPKG